MDWEKLLAEHNSALLLYARQWTNSRNDAEDAVWQVANGKGVPQGEQWQFGGEAIRR